MLSWLRTRARALRSELSELWASGYRSMKPMSVVPLILLLIIVLYAIYALRPH
jgi:RsiW-degrading membrane proteinase PrsW (M82 family)